MRSYLLARASTDVVLQEFVARLSIQLDGLHKPQVLSPGPSPSLVALLLSHCLLFIVFDRILLGVSHLDSLSQVLALTHFNLVPRTLLLELCHVEQLIHYLVKFDLLSLVVR